MEINIMFIGSSNVGKTTILKTYINKMFVGDTATTLGVDYNVEKREDVFVKFWDTAGQERFNSINFTYFKKADSVILVYDPSEDDEKIKHDIIFWLQKVNENNNIINSNNLIWIIANNKTDKYINEEKEKDKIQSIIKLFDKEYNITVLNGLKNNPTILQSLFENIIKFTRIKKITSFKLDSKTRSQECCCFLSNFLPF